MKIDRVEIADIGSPIKLAEAVTAQYGNIAIPVPIEDIALCSDILEIKEIQTSGFAGALLTQPERTTGIILYNQNHPVGKRRFTIGHELGHFLIPRHRPTDLKGFFCTDSDMRGSPSQNARMEEEANKFSARLLMPERPFSRSVASMGDPDLSHIPALAELYAVSMEAVSRRYLETTDDACAFVFVVDGRIRYVRRSENFPWLSRSTGDEIPRSTQHRMKNTPHSIVGPQVDVSSGTWIDNADACDEVYEQTITLANGYGIVMLQAEIRQDDDDE